MKNDKQKKDPIQNEIDAAQVDDVELSKKVDDFFQCSEDTDPVVEASPANTRKEKWIKMGKDHKVLAVVVILLILLALFRIGSAIYDRISPSIEKEEQVAVQTTVAGMADISSTAPITGRILPEEVAVVPLVSGKVTGIYVKVGDYVNAGTVLFEIDRTQATASYNQAKAAYDLASTAYNNAATLYSAGAVSKTSLDQAYVSYISAREAFNTAAEMYSYYSVTAPISGYVTSLSVQQGSIAGQTMAASIANTDSLSIDTTVSEYLATKLYQGEEVDIRVSSLKDKTYKGVISELSPAPAYGTLTYPITVSVKDTSGDIKAGMFAEVIVKDNESKNALCIPSDAVFSKAGEDIVVVLDKDNVASYAKVTTGIDNGEMVEILSGIKAGDVVVSSGQQYVSEGDKVKVIKNGTKASKSDSAASKSQGKDKK